MTEKQQIKLVVFDWAGTTTDFGSQAPVDVFDRTFRQKGLVFTKDEINAPMGMEKKAHITSMLSTERGRQLWQENYSRSWNEDDIEEVYQCFEANLRTVVAEYAKLIPGVKETVDKLREMGLKIGSTTGYTAEIMQYVLPVAKGQGYEPDCCVTPDVTEYSRPTPFMVFECMRRLNVFPPKLVVKAGDTVMDILEGKNAGAWSVGIIKGSSVVGLSEAEYNALSETERKELHEKARKIYMEAGADYVIEDITELPEVIAKINAELAK